MRSVLTIVVVGLATLLVGCGEASPGEPEDPLAAKPAAEQVLQMSDEFDFTFMPGASIQEVEWDVEIDYDTSDVQTVFDFYDDALGTLGFTRTSIDGEDDEVEAEYANAAGIEIDIEVERDDGRVQVDLDIDDFTGPYPTGFSLTSFAGIDIPIYDGADVVDVEWDFEFDHPADGADDVFDYYDGHLQSLGWTQTELDDGDDDEREAEYVKDGVHLELEVEDDDSVELEVNKLRFY